MSLKLGKKDANSHDRITAHCLNTILSSPQWSLKDCSCQQCTNGTSSNDHTPCMRIGMIAVMCTYKELLQQTFRLPAQQQLMRSKTHSDRHIHPMCTNSSPISAPHMRRKTRPTQLRFVTRCITPFKNHERTHIPSLCSPWALNASLHSRQPWCSRSNPA